MSVNDHLVTSLTQLQANPGVYTEKLPNLKIRLALRAVTFAQGSGVSNLDKNPTLVAQLIPTALINAQNT